MFSLKRPTFAEFHVMAGILVLILGMTVKQDLPVLGLSPYVQFPCAFLSSVLLPFGSFLGLYALLFQPGDRHRSHLAACLGGPVVICCLLILFFLGYVLLSKTVTMMEQSPNILPKLIEATRTDPKEERRVKVAYYVYQLYGVTTSYRRDDGQVVYYEPSEKEQAKRRERVATDLATAEQIAVVKKLTDQFPYLFALYSGTSLATLLLGGLLLFFRLPKSAIIPPAN